MDNIIIHPAAESDLPAINRLFAQVHQLHANARPDLFRSERPELTSDEFHAMLSNAEHLILVAVKADQILGYVICISKQYTDHPILADIRTLSIDDFCVDESARHEHIGKQLYEYVLDYARKQGFYNVTLNVWADNVSALRFYEQIGMRIQKIGMEAIL